MKGSRIFSIATGILILFLEANLWRFWHLTGGLLHRNIHALILAGMLVTVAGCFGVVVLWPRLAQRTAKILLSLRPKAKWLRWLLLAGWVVAFPYLTLYSPAREKFFHKLLGGGSMVFFPQGQLFYWQMLRRISSHLPISQKAPC